jgi:hypothetical protein
MWSSKGERRPSPEGSPPVQKELQTTLRKNSQRSSRKTWEHRGLKKERPLEGVAS